MSGSWRLLSASKRALTAERPPRCRFPDRRPFPPSDRPVARGIPWPSPASAQGAQGETETEGDILGFMKKWGGGSLGTLGIPGTLWLLGFPSVPWGSSGPQGSPPCVSVR